MKSSILMLSFLLSLSLLSARAQDDPHAGHTGPSASQSQPKAPVRPPATGPAGHTESQPKSKEHAGHTMPEQGQASGTAGGHEGHQMAPTTRGPWSYHDRENPKPYTKGRWEMVPGEGNTATFIVTDKLSEAERCRALLNNPAVAVDRVTRAACGAASEKKGQDKPDPGQAHDQHSNAQGGHWMAPPEAARRPNPVPASQPSLRRGREVFQSHCASCHGPQGRGDGPAGQRLKPKPADLTVMASQHPAGDIAWKIENGRGPMPAWKGTLSENQTWDLVNYIQGLEKLEKRTSEKTGEHGDHHH